MSHSATSRLMVSTASRTMTHLPVDHPPPQAPSLYSMIAGHASGSLMREGALTFPCADEHAAVPRYADLPLSPQPFVGQALELGTHQVAVRPGQRIGAPGVPEAHEQV